MLGVLGHRRLMDFGDGHRLRHRKAGLLDRRQPPRARPPAPTARSTSRSWPRRRRGAGVLRAAAVALGAEVLHEPRLWPEYHERYFGAFVRDPDGNNVEAVCHTAQPGDDLPG